MATLSSRDTELVAPKDFDALCEGAPEFRSAYPGFHAAFLR